MFHIFTGSALDSDYMKKQQRDTIPSKANTVQFFLSFLKKKGTHNHCFEN